MVVARPKTVLPGHEKVKNLTEFAPVFRPSQAEFKDFPAYLKKIEPQCSLGVCIVKPPRGFHARKDENYDNVDFEIQKPIQQSGEGGKGRFQLMLIERRKMMLSEFKAMAESDRYKPPSDDPAVLERKFWQSVAYSPALYGSDTPGTLFDTPDNALCRAWDLNDLDTILNKVDRPLAGINTPYLYAGMWKSMFAWHTEDLELYSVNYMHFGAPKHWYAVPPAHAHRLEALCESAWGTEFRKCRDFMRHKTTLLSPTVLKASNIPYTKIVQKPGDFVITFPRTYHAGFNCGFNVAEAVNFASDRWIPIGQEAGVCECQGGNVRVNVEKVFLGIDSSDDSDSSEPVHSSDTVPAPRKRGRPRKNALATPAGRGRGRPRKSEVDAAAPPAKKRGRPRKVKAEGESPAKRGRSSSKPRVPKAKAPRVIELSPEPIKSLPSHRLKSKAVSSGRSSRGGSTGGPLISLE